MNEMTRLGIEALKAGDRASARKLLIQAVKQSPEDAQAWMWLAGAVERDEERLDCLRRALKLDPNNAAAQKAVQQILQRQAQAAPIPSKPEPEPVPPPAPEETPVMPTNESAPKPVNLSAASDWQEFRDARPAPPSAPSAFTVDSFSGPAERIFSDRPSLVPALIGLWIIVLVIWLMNRLMQESFDVNLTLTLATCGGLGVLLLYAFIRLFATRYELTTQALILPYQGRRVSIPFHQIYHVGTEQRGFQKMLKIGDVVVEAAVEGVLTRARLRNLPKFNERSEAIRSMLPENE